MRPLPFSRRAGAPLMAVALLAGVAACSDDDDDATPITTIDVTLPDTSQSPDTSVSTTSGPDADGSAGATTDPDGADLVFGSGGSWSPDDLDGLTLTDDNTAPVIERADIDEVMGDHWVWDWWPVRDRSGEPTRIGDRHVAIALTAPNIVLPGKRHDIATLRYATSDDGGRTWRDEGDLFPVDDAEGSRQWAGSAMYDEDDGVLHVFYTAAGETGQRVEPVPASEDQIGTDGDQPSALRRTTPSTTIVSSNTDDTASSTTDDAAPSSTNTSAPSTTDDEPMQPSGGGDAGSMSYEQRLVMTTAAVTVDEAGIAFDDWTDHEVLLEGDGSLYAPTDTTSGGAGQIDAFRDPWFFEDPADGETYLLFTATMPDATCEGDGVVGIARSASEDLQTWELMPPLLDGHCVNNELERPQIVVTDDGRYLLLFTTHSHTFDGIEAPEGLYGFSAPSLTGPYEPLNGTGLVVANPDEAPYQAYSWMTMPNGVVTSFAQWVDIDPSMAIDEIGQQPVEFQMSRFVGSFAPSIVVEFDGSSSRIVDVLAPGQLEP